MAAASPSIGDRAALDPLSIFFVFLLGFLFIFGRENSGYDRHRILLGFFFCVCAAEVVALCLGCNSVSFSSVTA